MAELWELQFMRHAFVAGAALSIALAGLSFFVVLRGIAFMGVGIAHSAFGGVALGLALGLEPTLSALAFSVLVANLIGAAARRGAFREDTVIGIFFAATMALGVLIVGLSEGYTVDLFSYLFGSILAVGRAEVLQALVVSLLVLALLGAFFKEFLLESFDPQVAQASGLPVKLLQHLLLSAIALAVVVGIKLLGVVLASALLVAPAATALRLSSRYQKVLALAVLLSLACTMGGLLLAYWLDAAPGATIALCASGLFFASLLFPQRA